QGIYTEWGGPATIYVPAPQNSPILDSDNYRQIVEDVIRSIAEQQSAVIVGRAGQMVLRDHPGALHVRIVAALEDRVQWVMKHEKLDRVASLKLIKDTDRRRADYLKSYYKADWSDPQLYDLVLNASRLGADSCVAIVLFALAQKTGVAAG
ncbi:MAG: cytidylate kinase-like family protein, partial [Dehalococcoidia bacterium]|nr:cytidylate kinase-like family protein [Dehalococcoidia bacterium]